MENYIAMIFCMYDTQYCFCFQAPCQFDDDLVLRQLRYTGMMETVKIRKAGYSVRTDFEVRQ